MKFINKLLKIIIIFFVFFITYLFYKNILYRLYPWKIYNEKNCTAKGCYISEINQKFTYWEKKAVKDKSLQICNNANKFEKGSYVLINQEAIDLCKVTVAAEIGDIKNCELLSGRNKGTCYLMFSEKKVEK